MPVAFFFRKELLNRRKDYPSGSHAQLCTQVSPVGRLNRVLSKQIATTSERPKELIVEIVAIGQHHDGGVRHRRMQDDPSRIKGHGQTLTRSLGMPHHTHPPIAWFATWLMPRFIMTPGLGGSMFCRMTGCPQGFLNRYIHRMELMVARHLLDELALSLVFEGNEMPHQIQESPFFKDSFQHHLQLGHCGGRVLNPCNGSPGLKPFLPGPKSPDASLDTVRNDERHIGSKDRGNLSLVGLKLPVGSPDGGLFVRRVFQLDHGERKAIHEQDDIRSPLVLPL